MTFFKIISIAATILAANGYIAYKTWNLFPANSILKMATGMAVAVLTICFFSIFFLKDNLPPTTTAMIYKAGTAWFFISFYLLLAFLLLDIGQWIGLPLRYGIIQNNELYTALLGLFLTGIFVYSNYHYKQKERVALTLFANSKHLQKDTFKIVALSDLHLGYGIGKKEFESWIPLINREEADVVLFVGDLIDNDTKPLVDEDFASVFKNIRSKHGMFAVLGNHEYFAGIPQSTRFFEQAGITLLRDSTATIDNRLYVIGRDDRSNLQRKTLNELILQAKAPLPTILLDHQPYRLEEAEQNQINLQLSGHTHHGQVWPISWITDLIYEKAHGYLRKGETHYYISSGMGIWGGKFRIGTQSEYAVIRLITNPDLTSR